MASITCRHGGTEHKHTSVDEVRRCQGVLATLMDVQAGHYETSNTLLNSHGPYATSNTLQNTSDEPDGHYARYVPTPYTNRSVDENAAYKASVGEHWEQLEREAGGAPPQDGPVDEDGIYHKNDKYYKVQTSRSSGHFYAKVASVKQVEDGKGGYKNKWEWEYAKGAIIRLRKSDKVTAERATEFGKLWNICVNCFRELTHEESMDRGYGPVCADNLGWPYDHNRKG